MVKEEKIAKKEELKEMIRKYRILGLIDIFKLPSKQFQEIRKEIRGRGIIKVLKKSLLLNALKDLNLQNFEELEKIIPNQPAILLSNEEAFKIYSLISKLSFPTFAKEGDIASEDIKISAGPTSLLPGPAISELSKAGIPVGVEEGKIVVKKDVVVAKKGSVISKDLANVLRKLKVQPIRIGLNLVSIYEKGKIYNKEILELVNVYPKKLKEAFEQALNLSININYPTKENIQYLLIKAYQNALALEKFGGAK
ncbi:MAG: 50S ribosomal protein L10 [Candidatus Aenigmatarchaeota archaeon]